MPNVFKIGEGILETVKARVEMVEQKRWRIFNKKNNINIRNSIKFQKAFGKYKKGATLTREDL
jgi:hypothetical protein